METIDLDFAESLHQDLENLVVDGRGEDAVRILKSIMERIGLNRAYPDLRRAVVLLAADFVDANTSQRNGGIIPDERRSNLRERALSVIDQALTKEEFERLDEGARRLLRDQVNSLTKRSAFGSASRIFICYRRADDLYAPGRINGLLRARFGAERVFMDVHDMLLGADFRANIVGVLSNCAAVLVLIGPNWLSIRDENGQRRIDAPDDYVRIEIDVALKLPDVPIVPIFVGGALPPREPQLPADIQALCHREGQSVRADPDFENDMKRLIERLERRLT